jgi:hypothetical protein
MAEVQEINSELENSILKLSKDLLDKKIEQEHIRYKNIPPDGGFVFYYKFPIREIDNIPVNVLITLNEKSTHKHIDLNIQSSKIYLSEDDEIDEEDGPDELVEYVFNYEEIITDDDPKYTVEFIQEGLRIIHNKLKSLYFDKYNGKFMYKNENVSFKDWKTFLNIENVTLDFKECCVCLEMTSTETSCKHSLCIPCWSKIKYTKSEVYDDMDTLRCPYCRMDISF